MDHGRVEQVGTPQEVYERPATPFVYGFLGAVNRFVGHARGGVLRGGSLYRPQTSHWYFPQALRNDQHGKLLLMAPAKDRSGRIGFRCVVDAA